MNSDPVLGIIRSSSKALSVTSKNFTELRNQITDIHNERLVLQQKLNSEKSKLTLLNILHLTSLFFIFGFFYRKISIKRTAQIDIVKNLKEELNSAFVNLTFADKSQLEKSWLNCIDAFTELIKSEKVWDLTFAENTDSIRQRTIAKTSLKRSTIDYKRKEIEFIKSDLDYLFLPNTNGPDIYIYPTFLIFYKDREDFGIFDLKDINAVFEASSYIEEEEVPKDTETISHTWKKSNKDGSMDKRYKGNYQIPVVKYGQVLFETDSGLQECFMFSNYEAVVEFSNSYHHHIKQINP